MRSRRNIEWCRSKIHSPARWPRARVRLVGLELVERGVVGQVEQDHVVEVPAVRDVVPADEPDAELLLVSLHLAREDRPHEELEERVAAAADGEVGREHGHGRGGPPGGDAGGRGAYCRTPARPAARSARSAVGRRRRLGSASVARLRPRARRPSASRSPAGRGGRAPVGRDEAEQEDDGLAGDEQQHDPTNSRTALTTAGQSHTTLSGVSTISDDQHDRPGTGSSRARDRARASRSSPLYWTGPAVWRRGGVVGRRWSVCRHVRERERRTSVRRPASAVPRSPGRRRPRRPAARRGSPAAAMTFQRRPPPSTIRSRSITRASTQIGSRPATRTRSRRRSPCR